MICIQISQNQELKSSSIESFKYFRQTYRKLYFMTHRIMRFFMKYWIKLSLFPENLSHYC
jgi:hypothetical protein